MQSKLVYSLYQVCPAILLLLETLTEEQLLNLSEQQLDTLDLSCPPTPNSIPLFMYQKVIVPILEPTNHWTDFNPRWVYYKKLQRLTCGAYKPNRLFNPQCLPSPPDPDDYALNP